MNRTTPVHRSLRTGLFLLAWVAAFSDAAQAQEPKKAGVVAGRVFDLGTSEPLAGANVVVVGTVLGASTNAEGEFRITGVPVGVCALKVSAVGYEPFTRTDVVVSIARPSEVTVRLREAAIVVDSVQVTGNYFQKLPETPLSTFVQSSEEIRRLPGGLEDVVRAISILPGIAQVQAGRNDLIIRGGAPSENLFLIDNIEVANINHFGTQGATGGPLSYVNLDYVEGTSFSSGGFGVQYGDKLSSVLGITLRDGRSDRIGGKATISASQFGLGLEGPVDRDGTFVFSARRSYLDLIFRAAGLSFVPEYWDFLARGAYRLGRNDRLSVLGIAALDDVKFTNGDRQQRFDNSRILGDNQQQAVVGAAWQHLLGEGILTLSLAHSYNDYRYGQADSNLVTVFRNTSFQQETSLRADLVFHPAKTTEMTIGGVAKRALFAGGITLRPFVTQFGDSLGVDESAGTAAFKGALYAQVSQMWGRVTLTLGGRADYFDLIARKFALSPRISATLPLADDINLNASVGRYCQAPSYVWLVMNPANRDLTFIRANQYIVGVDAVLRPDTRVTLEGYVKDYADYPASLLRPYLVLANAGAGYGGSDDGYASFGLDPLASRGGGLARGVEFLVQKKLSEIPCYGTLSVSYSRSEFRALDGVTRSSSWDQRWIINVGGGYLMNEKWEFSAKFRFASGRPYTPFNADGTQDPALYNSVRVQPNHSLDVRIDRRWSFEGWALVTYIDVQNVYNRKPVDVPRYNPETRTAEQDASLGILPSIGVSAEF